MKSFLRAVTAALVMAFDASHAPAIAQTAPVSQPAVSTFIVHVHDPQNHPIRAAVITLHGPSGTIHLTSDASGNAIVHVPAGTYGVSVTFAGYQTASSQTVVADEESADVDVTLVANDASNLKTIAFVHSGTQTSHINTTITARSSLSAAQTVGVKQDANLRAYVYQIPGLHYYQSAKSSTAHFKIRGTDNEPRTELDGHPLTNTGAGNFLIGWLNANAFDSFSVEKGPGVSEGDEGRTIFGTVDLISHQFVSQPETEISAGVGTLATSEMNLLTRGSLGAKQRFQYVLGYNYAALPDPAESVSGLFLGPSRASSNANASSAVAQYGGSLAGNVGLRSETVKFKYDFSSQTSLSAGFIGFQGVAAPLGGNYAGYEGVFTIAPCFNAGVPATSPSQCTASSVKTNPAYAGLIGTKQPVYSGYTAGEETNNEPFFEAALTTHLGSNLITLSPFTGIVQDILTYASPTSPIANLPAAKYTSDRLHGTTFSFVHPLSNGYVKFNYEYHSDATLVYSGAPFGASTVTTPTTILRENDVSITSRLLLDPKLALGWGVFSNSSTYTGQVQNPAMLASGVSSNVTPFVPSSLGFSKITPHIGLVYQASPVTTLRAAFGSSIYGPGSTLISGRAAYTPPAPSNNNEGLITNVNPDLLPETEVGYELGADSNLRRLGIVSVSLYYDTIFNKFLSYTFQGPAITTSSGTSTPLVNQTINASLQRNYGVEFELQRERLQGWGYDLAVSLNREYYDNLPASYFTYATAPVSPFEDYQGTTNPYSTLHGELRYSYLNGAFVAFGGDTVGADNVQRAPGYTTFYAALRQPLTAKTAVLVSVENLFNYQTAAGIVGTGPAGSGASTINAFPSGSGFVYSQTPASVLQVMPRVLRVQLMERF